MKNLDNKTTAWLLFSDEQRDVLHENARGNAEGKELDPFPVAKLILPGTRMVWLITELDPEDNDTAFGLCDLGFGEPELGYVSLSEITETAHQGFYVQQDSQFKATKPLSEYVSEARINSEILA